MKSIFYSYFFTVLPWVLIVIIMIDLETRRTVQRRTWLYRDHYYKAQNTALPVIYAITPTYTRTVQKAELTRLANTFRQVPNFHWIVVEDSYTITDLVSSFLSTSGVQHTHLHVSTLLRYKRPRQPRGTEQRNAALRSLRLLRSRNDSGVVFFADDDNTYSLELFEEMRSTRRVSVWPVGLTGGRLYERPLVEKGRVVGWYTGWEAGRLFPIDMAGFAINLQVLLENPQAVFKRQGSKPGMQETDFLKQITRMEDLEPKASNCTRNMEVKLP
ncbi:galactosylgalactosylxylosylprotein 3-beta-glucuronosyltransferase 2-like isoform X2 [Paramormyrops kingsleyae]|uniref:galactosylgalactosylxylosylprotein 3-beta-glucuronosyltransferase 2-like isoform X2 n=1 Tax=Paramormyrops kingsleyae TaxID=1676925 RepID=UPI000CD64647|nr:galactosylgalactosylxylosylprotein 3-beta-glucuronosyltransferase 2-like isoform X2 [Paramormyrops kingsleyae]